MLVISILKIVILVVLCTYCSVTDFREGIIENRILLISVVVGTVLNIYEWILVSFEYLWIQIVNIAVTFVLAIFLYIFHIWAGGDCKFMITIAVLIPYGYYLKIINQWFALIAVFAFAFAFSYIFLIIDSVVSSIKKKHVVSSKKIVVSIKSFLSRYIACVSYIMLVNQIFAIVIPNIFAELRYVFLIFNICISFIVSGVKILRNKYIVIVVALAVVVLKIIQHQIIVSKSMLINYVIVFLMLLLRLFIDEYNYETIPTKEVKKGMILSTSTVALFFNSKVKGLPVLSSEDLRCRLTQEEVESILRWEHSKYGLETIQIVRKIPFAIFISLGTVLFLLLGVFT